MSRRRWFYLLWSLAALVVAGVNGAITHRLWPVTICCLLAFAWFQYRLIDMNNKGQR